MKSLTTRVLCLAAIVAAATSSQAQTLWNGNTSNNWFTPANWTPPIVPGSGDNVQIDTNLVNPAVVKIAGAQARSISVGTNFGDNGTLRLTNTGTLEVFTAPFTVGNAGNGTVLLRDTTTTTVDQNMIIGAQSGSMGDVTVRDNAELIVAGQLRVGDFGTGSLTSLGTGTSGFISASHMDIGTFTGGVGTVDLSNAGGIANLGVSGVTNVGTSGTGMLNVHDGGYMFTQGLSIGTNFGGNGTVIIKGEIPSGAFVSTIDSSGFNIDVGQGGTGDLELRTGGAALADNIHIGRDAGSVGTLLVQGLSPVTNTASTLTAGNDLSVGGTQVGPGGQGTLTIKNNGVVNVANNMWVWGGGTGTGGTLEVDNTATLTVGGTLDFDGGTLHFLGSGVNFANNVTFGNTQSPNGMIAVVDPGENDQLSGLLSGPGGLTLTGGGTLQMTQAVNNTYAGVTTVIDGKLQLNGNASRVIPGDLVIGLGTLGPNSAVVVLQQSSEIANSSNVTINSDGRFNMNGFGETIHNLIINDGNVTNVPTNGSSLALNGTLNMTGGSISGGTGATPGLLLNGANSNVTATSDASGNAALIASNVDLGGATRTFTVNDGPGGVDLSITGVIQDSTTGLIKEGTGTLEFASATGNTYTGTTNVNNGVLSLNGPAGTNQIPDNVVIGDNSGGANSAVVILQAADQIADSANMRIRRDGEFDMNGFGETINNLVINRGNVINVPTDGVSSLALLGTLDMTGGSISGGTGATPGLLLEGVNSDVTATSDGAGNAALIASNVDLGGATRTFTVNDGPGGVDLSITGVIQDSTTGLIKEGAGTLEFASATGNTYTGPTRVNDGVLSLNGPAGTDQIPDNIIIGDNSGGANSAVVILQAASQIADSANMRIRPDGEFDMNGFGETIHNLVIVQGNVINVPTDGVSSLALLGSLDMTGGSISGGTGATPGLLLAGPNSDVTATSDAAGNAALIASNVDLGGATRTFTVNDGPGAVDLSITGVIQDSTTGLIKEGAGTLEFASATGNTYTGTTRVNDGVLSLNGPVGTNQIPDDVVIGDGNGGANSAVVILQANSQIANSANMTVKRDGLFDMNGFGETIHNLVINRGNVANLPAGIFNSLTLLGTLDMTGGTISGGTPGSLGLVLAGANSNVTATSDAAGNAALIASNITLGGMTRTFTVNDGPGAVDLEVDGVIRDNANAGLIKEGDGLMHLTAVNTYTGDTTINAGEVQLDGSIASAQTTVNLGGILSGNGVVGGNLTNKGTVSPGDSPGTLFIAGNYTQTATGNLVIQIASLTNHDLLVIGGVANLDGNLQLVKLANFSVVAGDRIVFLDAAGGVNGQFATITGDFGPTGTLITPEIIYEPNDVALLFAQGSFVLPGLTPNQTAVAANLNNAVGDQRALALIDFLDTEPLANLPHDYDLIAPEELAALYEMEFAKAIVQNMNIQHRMDDIRAGANGFSSGGLSMNATGAPAQDPGLSYGFTDGKVVLPVAYTDGKVVLPVDNKDKNILTPTPENRWGVFVTGSGDFVNVDGDDNAHGYDITSGTVLVGLDYRVCDHLAVGMNGSYSGGRADLVDHGRIDMDGGQVGAYATVYGLKFLFGNVIHFDAGVNGGWNDYDTHRTGLQGLPVRGSTNGSEFNAFLAYGGDWHFGHLLVGTWSTLQYTDVNINAFAETGSLAPLFFPDQDEDSFRSSTGLRLAYDASFGRTIFRPEVRAGWEHEYGDRAYPIDAGFASGAGGIFTVHGPSIGRDSALVDAGFTILWSDRVSTYFFYDGNLGRSNYDNNAVSGGLRVTF